MRSRQTQTEQRFGGGDSRPCLGNTKERALAGKQSLSLEQWGCVWS